MALPAHRATVRRVRAPRTLSSAAAIAAAVGLGLGIGPVLVSSLGAHPAKPRAAAKPMAWGTAGAVAVTAPAPVPPANGEPADGGGTSDEATGAEISGGETTGDGNTGGKSAPAEVVGDRAAEGGQPGPPGGRAWPVDVPGRRRPVVAGVFAPPSTPWGAGHRGVDLSAPPGTPVRSAAAGTVSFAGTVAGRGVVSVELAGGGSPALRATHEPVTASVRVGERVRAGQVLGILQDGPFHCPNGCLHWGLLRGRTYLDPLSLLSPGMLRAAPSRLLPIPGAPTSARRPGGSPLPGAGSRAAFRPGARQAPGSGERPGARQAPGPEKEPASGPRNTPAEIGTAAVLMAGAAWARRRHARHARPDRSRSV